MNLEEFSLEELRLFSNITKHMQAERAVEGKHTAYGPSEQQSLENQTLQADMIKNNQYEQASKSAFDHFGSFDKLSAEEQDFLGRAIKHMQAERAVEGRLTAYGPSEQQSLEEQTLQADMIKHNQYENASRAVEDNYGSYDKLSESQITSLKNMIAFMRQERAVSGTGTVHHGSIDDVIVSGNYGHLESARLDQKISTAFAKKYLDGVAKDPKTVNEEDFRSSVTDGIRSNEVLDKFYTQYVESLSSKIASLKTVDKTDAEAMATAKGEIEGYLGVYSKLMYELKVQDASVDFDKLKFPDEIKDDLFQAQKSFDSAFEMPIPGKIGEYQPMQAMGDAISVINRINGYTPQGYIGKILGENPDYTPDQRLEPVAEIPDEQ